MSKMLKQQSLLNIFEPVMNKQSADEQISSRAMFKAAKKTMQVSKVFKVNLLN